MTIDDIYIEFSDLLDAINGNHLTVGDMNSAKIALDTLRSMRSPEAIMHDILANPATFAHLPNYRNAARLG